MDSSDQTPLSLDGPEFLNEWAKTPPLIQQTFQIVVNQIADLTNTVHQLQNTIDSTPQPQPEPVPVADPVDPETILTEEWLTQLSAMAAARPRTPKQVVFVSNQPASRQAKLASALREVGWDVILIYCTKPNFEPEKFFTASHQYRYPNEALLMALQYAPVSYHCFASWTFDTAALLVKMKPGPVVFDDYDIFAGIIEDQYTDARPVAVEKERYCMEHSNGMCNRSLNAQVAKKTMGYKFSPDQIFFPEYCWHTLAPSKPPRAKRTDGLHVVHVGGLAPEQFFNTDQDCHGYFQGQDIHFVRELSERKIHYHIYPYFGAACEEDIQTAYGAIFEESDRNPYFHFHRPVAPEDLADELSQYHLGLVFTSEKVLEKKTDGLYKHPNRLYGTFNKAFDYLDAGLPIVMYGFKLKQRLLGRDGPYIVASREKCPDVLAGLDPEHIQKYYGPRVEEAKNRLSALRHIPRLVRFYEKLGKKFKVAP